MSTVVAQPYSTTGNGGRKLVRLNDGTLIGAVIETTVPQQIRVYRSEDRGTAWTLGLSYTINAVTDLAMVNLGSRYGMIWKTGNSVMFATANKDNGEQNSAIIDSGQSAVGAVSLAIDPTNGHLHAAWASKNATYTSSFNIRYAKSTDGGVTWSVVEQVSAYNSSNIEVTNPSIVVVNSMPVILVQIVNSITTTIQSFVKQSTWSNKLVHNGATRTQSYPSAVVDKNGVIHVAWQDQYDGNNWRIDYAKSVDGGITWSTAITIATFGVYPSITVDNKNKLVVMYNTSNDGDNLKKTQSTDGGTAWSTPQDIFNGTASYHNFPSTLYDATFPFSFGDIPPTIYQRVNVEYIGTYTTNNAPTVTLTSPIDNQTLYENDTLNITGTAYDADKDQSVTVYYQINSEQRKVLATNLSQTQISLTKQLMFKGGKLFDGDASITGTLAEGVAHTLKVWAVDSENASSTVVERAFYVVPNRAPLLTVNPPTPSGIIDVDSFVINGTFEDADKNETTVSYRINGANPVQVASGVSGTFDFTITLGALIVGENAITVEAIDSYGAKTSQTVKLRKNRITVPMTKSVARYKIVPPSGTASEILVWVQRDAELTLKASASMTLAGEQESFTPMTLTVTENLQNGQVEDEFYLTAGEAKDSIVLQLELEKANPSASNSITLIMGVL